jgi:hypothetical protein
VVPQLGAQDESNAGLQWMTEVVYFAGSEDFSLRVRCSASLAAACCVATRHRR